MAKQKKNQSDEIRALQSITDSLQSRISGGKEEVKIRQQIVDSLKSEASYSEKIVDLEDLKNDINAKYFGVNEKIGAQLKSQINLANKLNKSLNAREELIEDITDKVDDMYSSMIGNIENIPIVGEHIAKALDVTGIGEQFKTVFADKIQGAITKTAKVFGVAGTSIAATIAVATLGIAALIYAIAQFVKLGFEANSQTVELAKSFSLSRDEAAELNQEFRDMAENSNAMFNMGTRQNITEAHQEISDLIRMQADVSQELLDSQITLTKVYGFTGEEAANLLKLAKDRHETGLDIAAEIDHTIELYNQSHKIQLNNLNIMKAVADVSAELRMLFKGSVQELTNAVLVAGKMGITLEEVKDIGMGLLDIESSLQAEMEARVMTGKAINLDRAREAMLAGDLVTVGQELQKIAGTKQEFMEMDILQREALANAMGVEVDKMAEMLEFQEQRQKYGKTLAEMTEEDIRRTDRMNDKEKAMHLKRLANITAQEKFSAAMTRLGDLLVERLAPAAEEFANWLEKGAPAADSITSAFKTTMDIIKVIGGAFTFFWDLLAGAYKMIAGIITLFTDWDLGVKKLGEGITQFVLAPMDMVNSVMNLFSDNTDKENKKLEKNMKSHSESMDEMAQKNEDRIKRANKYAGEMNSGAISPENSMQLPGATTSNMEPGAVKITNDTIKSQTPAIIENHQITNRLMTEARKADESPEMVKTLKEQNELMKQLISSVNQPAVIKFGAKTVDEIGKITTMKKNIRANVDSTYGHLGY